jgi:EAL domain-containing protein (putative c-di-GMP-specific phosphodiesterase class I)
MMQDVDLAVDALGRLRELGVRLAVDDFGTGYSSLTYIRRFPLDILKIDRSFVQDLGDGPAQTQALIAGIVGMARTLGVTPLAEGIEDERQLAAVRALGCDLGQGYHLHRPMPLAALQALLAAPQLAAVSAS